MKLEVEIDIPGDAVDKVELQHRVRRETILILLADRKLALVQAADELGLSQSDIVALLRQRGKEISLEPTQHNEPLSPTQSWSHRSQRDLNLLERFQREAALMAHPPTLEEVHAALACIPGSMSDVVISERGDY